MDPDGLAEIQYSDRNMQQVSALLGGKRYEVNFVKERHNLSKIDVNASPLLEGAHWLEEATKLSPPILGA